MQLAKTNLPLAIKILYLDDAGSIENTRGQEIRQTFLMNGGLDLIEKLLPSYEGLLLLIASCKKSEALKKMIVEYFTHTWLAEIMPGDISSLYLLFEISCKQ